MSTTAHTLSEITPLDHEVLYHSMESWAFKAQFFSCSFATAFLTCKQTKETHRLRLLVYNGPSINQP